MDKTLNHEEQFLVLSKEEYDEIIQNIKEQHDENRANLAIIN